ncbi:hypothetical protein ACFFGH_34025 [Lysobacter korlensis]|uniref:Knr4/Smi1-like domain-containing protein n=1 Tax=Lysobacter korlensis TaxID=553636 RepID=A0ABV6S0Y4_9GAMM
MAIPAVAVKEAWKREEPLSLQYLETVGFQSGSVASEFFATCEGPFSSSRTGFLLLNAGDPTSTECVEYSTAVARSKFSWPEHYLVISDLLAGSVLVYDAATDAVYTVDFEGGDSLLIQGTLAPDFPTFLSFLQWYFAGEC